LLVEQQTLTIETFSKTNTKTWSKTTIVLDYLHILRYKGYLCLKVLREQNIGRLDISMNYSPLTAFMEVVKAIS